MFYVVHSDRNVVGPTHLRPLYCVVDFQPFLETRNTNKLTPQPRCPTFFHSCARQSGTISFRKLIFMHFVRFLYAATSLCKFASMTRHLRKVSRFVATTETGAEQVSINCRVLITEEGYEGICEHVVVSAPVRFGRVKEILVAFYKEAVSDPFSGSDVTTASATVFSLKIDLRSTEIVETLRRVASAFQWLDEIPVMFEFVQPGLQRMFGDHHYWNDDLLVTDLPEWM